MRERLSADEWRDRLIEHAPSPMVDAAFAAVRAEAAAVEVVAVTGAGAAKREGLDPRDEFIEWLGSLRPIFQKMTCCDFPAGSHYNPDGTLGGVQPPHEPTPDPLSGIVSLDYRMLQEALARLGGSQKPPEAQR